MGHSQIISWQIRWSNTVAFGGKFEQQQNWAALNLSCNKFEDQQIWTATNLSYICAHLLLVLYHLISAWGADLDILPLLPNDWAADYTTIALFLSSYLWPGEVPVKLVISKSVDNGHSQSPNDTNPRGPKWTLDISIPNKLWVQIVSGINYSKGNITELALCNGETN